MSKDIKLNEWKRKASQRMLPLRSQKSQRHTFDSYGISLSGDASLETSNRLLIDVINVGSDHFLIAANDTGAILGARLTESGPASPHPIRKLLLSETPKLLLRGKAVLTNLKYLGTHMRGSLLDLELCCNLLAIPLMLPPQGCSMPEWCRAAFALADSVTEQLEHNGMAALASMECECLPVIVELERTGIAVDWVKAYVLDMQLYNKLKSFQCQRSGRVTSTYKQLGTETGRITTSSYNIQGTPRDQRYRQCFIAEPGNKLVIGDYSQMELRVVAALTKDATLTHYLQARHDLHRSAAALISGKAEADISASERQAAKAVNFGLIYGASVTKIQETCAKEFSVVWDYNWLHCFKRDFFARHAGIAAWHLTLNNNSVRQVRTLGNRVRQWEEPPAPSIKYNSVAQGSAADIFKKAIVLLSKRIEGSRIRLVALVHDEILIEAPEGMGDEARKILEESMLEGAAYYAPHVPFEVSVVIGDSWADKT